MVELVLITVLITVATLGILAIAKAFRSLLK